MSALSAPPVRDRSGHSRAQHPQTGFCHHNRGFAVRVGLRLGYIHVRILGIAVIYGAHRGGQRLAPIQHPAANGIAGLIFAGLSRRIISSGCPSASLYNVSAAAALIRAFANFFISTHRKHLFALRFKRGAVSGQNALGGVAPQLRQPRRGTKARDHLLQASLFRKICPFRRKRHVGHGFALPHLEASRPRTDSASR